MCNTFFEIRGRSKTDLSIAADDTAVGCGVRTEHVNADVTQPLLKGLARCHPSKVMKKVTRIDKSLQNQGLKMVIMHIVGGS